MKRLEAALLLVVVVLLATRPARLLVVRGGSMSPAMAVGDVAVVVDRLAVEPGDVACFVDAGGLVCHRVVGRDPAGWRTRGDANGGEDTRVVPRHALVGKVVAVLPFGGPIHGVSSGLAAGLTLLYHRLRDTFGP